LFCSGGGALWGTEAAGNPRARAHRTDPSVLLLHAHTRIMPVRCYGLQNIYMYRSIQQDNNNVKLSINIFKITYFPRT
jgi:hypothetical protein